MSNGCDYGAIGAHVAPEPQPAAEPVSVRTERLRQQVYDELLDELQAAGTRVDSRQIQWIVDEFPRRLAKKLGRACVTGGVVVAGSLR